MFANPERAQGIDPKDAFARMLNELPWAHLHAYIQDNAALHKMCTFGGHRLEPKKRQRLEKIIYREAEKNDFSEASCSGLFAAWYPVHEEPHTKLENYFHSDEYRDYRKEKELGEDDYVLSDEKFDEFFVIREQPAWRILLHFSPLKFTDAQADRILDESQGNTDLLDQIAEQSRELEQLRRRDAQFDAEQTRMQEQQQAANAEILELKKQLRNMRSERDAMQQKYDSAQAETRRLQQRLQDNESRLGTHQADLEENFKRDMTRLQNDYNRISEQLATWQSKYEEQRLLNRGLERDKIEADKAKALAETESARLSAEKERNSKFADLLLSRIDWPKAGAAMKMNPTLRRNFNSLVRKLNYEEDRSLTIEGTFTEFWEKLNKSEEELVRRVAQSNALEVMGGDLPAFWEQVSELFIDVQINLEARSFLLGFLQEIFFQTIEMGDLQMPVIPKNKRKK